MKRIAILMVTALMSLAAAAAPIRYFTKSQATRTVSYLNAQNELMIYCGYDYEIETYVLLNEVWAERVNSSYYELWVFGYDAYTGEEIYMPLDLQCVWLYSAGRMYSAAQYLRFYTTARPPQLTWYVPAYHPYTRIVHRPGYVRTYHYNVHCYGWMPPAPPHGGYGPGMPPPMHPYYMRAPQAPAPRPVGAWTPGVDRPQVNVPDAGGRTDAPRSGATTVTTRPSAQPSGTARTGSTSTSRSGSATSGTTTNSRSSSATGTSTSRSGSATSGTTTNSRSSSATGTSTSRSSGTSTSGTTTSRSSGTSTSGTSTSRSASTGTTPTRTNTGSRTSGSTSATTTSRTSDNSKSSSTTTSRAGSSSRASGTTTSRTSDNSKSSGTTTSRTGSSSRASGTTTSRSSAGSSSSRGTTNRR